MTPRPAAAAKARWTVNARIAHGTSQAIGVDTDAAGCSD